MKLQPNNVIISSLIEDHDSFKDVDMAKNFCLHKPSQTQAKTLNHLCSSQYWGI